MRKWFVFGILLSVVGALVLLWYINRDDEDVQALTDNLVGKVKGGISGTREAVSGVYGRLRGQVADV
jgi:hypothetical protein